MKKGFYSKLALSGIRKNKRLYKPYIFTCIGMVMMFYIMASLSYSSALDGIRGVEMIKSMLSFGTGVIGIFSLIFLFYTNSFLIRKRKKEFGLYNILGMSKKNISVILLNETIMLYLLSLILGLLFGIVFSKFAELALLNIMQKEVTFALSVSLDAILKAVWIYAIIFVLILLNSLRQIHLSNPINLLRSENAGEKPPKANWFFAIIGLLMLGVAYCLAVTIKSPVDALVWFFVAVILVIIATYILFVSGSVTLCRLLQKNKKYYYKANHFVSVSSMAFRMKRNGAGLASVCILSTMVLVTISTTLSIYIGKEESLKTRFPNDFSVTVDYSENVKEEDITNICNDLNKTAENNGNKLINTIDYSYGVTYGVLTDDFIETDITKAGSYDIDDVYQVYYIPLSDYNRIMKTNETLNQNEALIFDTVGDFKGDSITVGNAEKLKVKKRINKMFVNGMILFQPCIYIVADDIDECTSALAKTMDYRDQPMLTLKWSYAFDVDADAETQIALNDKMFDCLDNYGCGFSLESAAASRSSLNISNGGTLFLGAILSIVFIFAAVLIIYYKQISEGYEDRSRFEIMQKVGMTKREIRKSINSQILTVFFLPLITAGLHLAFAFPMLKKLVELFFLYNTAMLITVTVCSLVVFAIFYALVYKITSNAYYSIVSGAGEEI